MPMDPELKRALVRLRRIEDTYEETGRLFEDVDFLPEPGVGPIPTWLRPQELSHHDGRELAYEEDWQLFRGPPRSEDVQQGALGDCWFLGALAALAEFQEGRFVRALLPRQRHRSRAGAYLVHLCLGGCWRTALVDDRLPCRSTATGTRALAYCKTGRLQLWASIVEKGLAKMCGSYEATIGGFTGDAFTMITGWPTTAVGLDLPCHTAAWALLQDLARDTRLVSCSSRRDVKHEGLHSEHVYTLLGAMEVHPAPGHAESARLLKLRDPHKTSEWWGQWSDGSRCWTPELRAQFEYHEGSSHKTGIIFMALEDFLRNFLQVDVCEARAGDWSEQRLPLDPVAGASQGLAIEAADGSMVTCVVSLCLPYIHAEAKKCALWLALLRIEERQAPTVASVRLLARTRFTRESTASLEFVVGAGRASIVVPFRAVPAEGPARCRDSGTPQFEAVWACFGKKPLRCEICHLAQESFSKVEDASANAYHWLDHGARGLTGDTSAWQNSVDLHMMEALRLH